MQNMESVEMMGPSSEEATIVRVRRGARAAMSWLTFEAAPETIRSPHTNDLPEFFLIQSIAR